MQEQNGFTVRNADAGDLSTLLEMGIRTFNEAFADVNRPEDMEAYLGEAFAEEQVATEMGDPLSTFLIAESDGSPVGYAKLYRGEVPDCVTGKHPIELARLYVVRNVYGLGVGNALMNGLINIARQEGYETMWLGVWEHNERAKAFYRKHGFTEVGSHIFQLGSDAQTDLVMERRL